MNIKRRDFLIALGTLGTEFPSGTLTGALMAESISGARTNFSGAFNLASSPLTGAADLPGIRLRWNFPLFDSAGNIAECLPEKVVVYRDIRPLKGFFLPPAPEVGLPPIALFPPYAWKSNRALQMSSRPYCFAIIDGNGAPAPTAALLFKYRGPTARLKILGARGNCLLASQLADGVNVYFDGVDITSFEIDTLGAGNITLADLRCIDFKQANEITPDRALSELLVRKAFVDAFAVGESAKRLHGRAGTGGPNSTLPSGHQFIDSGQWVRLLQSAAEIYGGSCAGSPSRKKVAGEIELAPLDLFLLALSSRWEMAARLGFGFRDGADPPSAAWSRCKYDQLNAAPIGDQTADAVAIYQVRAYSGTKELFRSNSITTRLDRRFPLSAAPRAGYFADVGQGSQSNYVAIVSRLENPPDGTAAIDRVIGESRIRWTHARQDRAAGVLVSETLSSPNVAPNTLHHWLYHRGVYDEGFTGSVAREIPMTLGTTVASKIRVFDAWDQLSQESTVVEPLGLVNYKPAAPPLACATFLADPDEPFGRVRIERLVALGGINPSCAGEGHYPEWAPEAMLGQLMAAGFTFRLQILEATKKALQQESAIKEYGVDQIGNYVRLQDSFSLGDFVDGRLDAQNGSYCIRSFIADRLYIGRFRDEVSGDGPGGDGFCQIGTGAYNQNEIDEPIPGRCVLTQNRDHPSFWRSVQEENYVPGRPFTPVFEFPVASDRPTEFADMLEYSCRILGSGNGQTITGEYSNIVPAQRTAKRPASPKPFTARILGYDYYDRLLVAVSLAELEPVPYSFELWIAPGWRNTAEDFLAVAQRSGLLGNQLVEENRTIFDALNIGRDYQNDRLFTIGVMRVNSSGTSGLPRILPIQIPAE